MKYLLIVLLSLFTVCSEGIDKKEVVSSIDSIPYFVVDTLPIVFGMPQSRGEYIEFQGDGDTIKYYDQNDSLRFVYSLKTATFIQGNYGIRDCFHDVLKLFSVSLSR